MSSEQAVTFFSSYPFVMLVIVIILLVLTMGFILIIINVLLGREREVVNLPSNMLKRDRFHEGKTLKTPYN